MSDEELRVKIYLLTHPNVSGVAMSLDEAFDSPDRMPLGNVPNYPADLNAMHEAAMWLRKTNATIYGKYIRLIVEMSVTTCKVDCIDTPARQRAEAFVQCLGARNTDSTRTDSRAETGHTL